MLRQSNCGLKTIRFFLLTFLLFHVLTFFTVKRQFHILFIFLLRETLMITGFLQTAAGGTVFGMSVITEFG
jgi:hypothetical protein